MMMQHRDEYARLVSGHVSSQVRSQGLESDVADSAALKLVRSCGRMKMARVDDQEKYMGLFHDLIAAAPVDQRSTSDRQVQG